MLEGVHLLHRQLDVGVDLVVGEHAALGEEGAVLIEVLQRLAQRAADRRDVGQLLGRQVVQVLVHRVAWMDLVLDRPNPRTVRNGHCGRSACQRKRWRLAQLRQRSGRSEEHTSELQSLMRISYAVFCLKKKNTPRKHSSDYKQ